LARSSCRRFDNPRPACLDCISPSLELKREENFISTENAHAVAAASPAAAKALALSFRRRMRSYVPAPSTENTMPSAAKCGSAGSGTKTSPVAQLLPEKRPSKYPNARRRISTVGKRTITIERLFVARCVCASANPGSVGSCARQHDMIRQPRSVGDGRQDVLGFKKRIIRSRSFMILLYLATGKATRRKRRSW